MKRTDLHHQLARIAREQEGYFSAAQALDAGFSYQAQRHHVNVGNWIRVDRGIFQLREWPSSPHADLIRWTLWSRFRGVVSHETALALHDLGDVNPSRIHLTVPPDFRAKVVGVLLHREFIPDQDIDERAGFRVTSPLRSLLDVAASNTEMDQLHQAVVDAIERGIVTANLLRARADSFGPAAALRIERSLQKAP